MHETSARGWCTGMTQRDGMGREVGGRIWMGNTCKSMVLDLLHLFRFIRTHESMIHVSVWQKPLQYCKVISLQLIKINGKKK